MNLQFVKPLLAALGLAVLFGDVSGDLSFFSDPSLRTTALVGSALVRNLLTLSAVIALFMNRRWGAYLLLGAGILGGARRLSFLAPLASDGMWEQWLLVHSGADIAFRSLLLGVGIGYFLAQDKSE